MTAVPDLNWKDGQGFLLVFDITDPPSFANLGALRERITKVTERKQVSKREAGHGSGGERVPNGDLCAAVPFASGGQQS